MTTDRAAFVVDPPQEGAVTVTDTTFNLDELAEIRDRLVDAIDDLGFIGLFDDPDDLEVADLLRRLEEERLDLQCILNRLDDALGPFWHRDPAAHLAALLGDDPLFVYEARGGLWYINRYFAKRADGPLTDLFHRNGHEPGPGRYDVSRHRVVRVGDAWTGDPTDGIDHPDPVILEHETVDGRRVTRTAPTGASFYVLRGADDRAVMVDRRYADWLDGPETVVRLTQSESDRRGPVAFRGEDGTLLGFVAPFFMPGSGSSPTAPSR